MQVLLELLFLINIVFIARIGEVAFLTGGGDTKGNSWSIFEKISTGEAYVQIAFIIIVTFSSIIGISVLVITCDLLIFISMKIYKFVKWTGCCRKKKVVIKNEEPEIIRKIREKQAKKLMEKRRKEEKEKQRLLEKRLEEERKEAQRLEDIKSGKIKVKKNQIMPEGETKI